MAPFGSRRRSKGPALAIAAAALGAAAFSWTPLQDRDWPWHLADFERMRTELAFPWNDVWSYASEGEHLPVHWIFEILLGAAHAAFGVTGIALVRTGLVALVFAVLARALVRRGLGPVAASGVSLTIAALARMRLIERPHLGTMLGIVLVLDLLIDFRDGHVVSGSSGTRTPPRKRLLALLPIFCVWANFHPGVVYGALLAAGFAAAELLRLPLSRRLESLRAMPRDRALALAGWVGIGIVATCITPYGPRLYPYLFAHRSMQSDLAILELRHIDLTNKEDLAFVIALSVALLIALRSWREVDLTDAGAAVGFAALGILAPRESALALEVAALAIAPALADTIGEARDELRDKERRLVVFARVFGIVAGFGYPIWAIAHPLEGDTFGSGLRHGAYPELEAAWILREKPTGPLWNTNASGGYLIWALDPVENPRWRVFTDGRQPLFRKALQIKRWDEIEGEYAPNLVVLDFLSAPFFPFESSDARFAAFREHSALVHFSDGGRTYVRREGPNAALAARAYRRIWFSVVKDATAREGCRTGIEIDASNPNAVLDELARGALAEEPGGAWANIARARAFLALGRQREAIDALHVALRANAGEVAKRECLSVLSETGSD